MSDKILDTPQLINGIAILLSFYAGYKYGTSILSNKNVPTDREQKEDTKERIFADFSNYKMILVVRNDLKMGKGKIAAQCGHAAVGAYQTAIRTIPHIVRRWEESGCAKIAVKVESGKELDNLQKIAKANNFNVCMIRDAGRTQISPNTKTVLAIGPATVDDIDRITGHLKLL